MSRSQIIAYNKEIYIYICDSFVIKAPLTFLEVFRELNEFKDFFPSLATQVPDSSCQLSGSSSGTLKLNLQQLASRWNGFQRRRLSTWLRQSDIRRLFNTSPESYKHSIFVTTNKKTLLVVLNWSSPTWVLLKRPRAIILKLHNK